MRIKTLMAWSSGKDSAWALHKLQQNLEIDLVGLFCTINKESDRVVMHDVRVELLQKQAKSIGLPLEIIEIPYPCSNTEYDKIMEIFAEKAKNDNVEYFAFGDLFLKGVRNYREEKLKGTGIKPIFPIWGIPTDVLSREMIRSGLRTVITCINPKQTPSEFIGKEFDDDFLDSLPNNIDPCGENGEFHSFVFDGPMFKNKIEILIGDIVHRDDFLFVDILPKAPNE